MEYERRYEYALKSEHATQTEIKGLSIETDFIRLNAEGVLTLRAGYSWNGATNAFDTADFMEASAFHDALYQLIEIGELDKKHRAHADKLMQARCVANGMGWLRSKYVYAMVRLFGGYFIKKLGG